MKCILYDFRRDTNRTEYKTVDLETFEERRTRWRSIRIIYLTMFVMSTGFTIILTGVWPYLAKVYNTSSILFSLIYYSLLLPTRPQVSSLMARVCFKTCAFALKALDSNILKRIFVFRKACH